MCQLLELDNHLKNSLLARLMYDKKKYSFCILLLFTLFFPLRNHFFLEKKNDLKPMINAWLTTASMRTNAKEFIPKPIITSKLSSLAGNFINYAWHKPLMETNSKDSLYHVLLIPPSFTFSNDLPVVDGAVEVVEARIERDFFDDNKLEERVAKFISRRYRLPYEPIYSLVRVTFDTGRLSGIDPLLLLAVIATESTFNASAVSRAGAKGLMQVMPLVHSDKFKYFGGISAVFEPYANMQVGTRILKDCLKKRGSLASALRCYVGAKKKNDGGYAKKVLAARKLFSKAAKKVDGRSKLVY